MSFPHNERMLGRLLLCLAVIFSTLVIHIGPGNGASAGTRDDQRIVYLDRDNNVWVMATDGSGEHQLTTEGGFRDVRWSSDGTRIVATGPFEGGAGVYLMSPDPEFGLRSLSPGHSPAWSPDTSRFAFIDGGDVHVFDHDGEYQRTVEAGADRIEWSPDGQRVGFSRRLVDPYNSGCAIRQIGSFNANTGEVETGGSMIGDFAWNAEGTGQIYVSTSDGAVRERSVTNDSSSVITHTTINPCGAPFFTSPDGEHLIGLRWFGEGVADLVVVNLRSGVERLFQDMPVRYPASRLPESYLTMDHTGRYVYMTRSYPTDLHRLDLETHDVTPILTNDWRRVIDVAPEGNFYSLLNNPTGRPTEMTIRDLHEGMSMLENVGWLSWQASPVNKSAALAWRQTWAREDRPVAGGESRTWLWGPEHFDVRVEEYRDAPGGFRAVRYYDKSRMEITNPAGDRTDDWYVTNGLLVRELITGDMQVGDSDFVEREPAEVPVAGDEDDPEGPTYATLQGVLDAPPTVVGQEITATINRDGEIGDDGPGDVTAEHYVEATDHTVADVFWDYLNSDGPIWDGTAITDGRLFDPTFFATGYPITEAYWSTVRVGGEEREVLLQCFERRCLTYTPDNPEGWEVEMGNVGRHYHAWRY